jgi:enamine deaminase RidA (YjgF/YER057c/UK114 family)
MATREGRTSHHPGDLFDASQYGFAQAVSVDAGRPASTWVRVGGLEGDGLLVEIEATAVIP